MREDRIDRAQTLISQLTETGAVGAAALLIRHGDVELTRGFGRAETDTVFLLASITKPMTATGVLVLRDRGEIALDDPVRAYLPEFRGGDRDHITIRHLLTHTSGLPDMLPEDIELRKRHAPLREFVEKACETPLLFEPGTVVSYQSMGILLASAVVERVTHRPFRDFLRDEVFVPLGMADTSLGLGGRSINDTAHCQVAEQTAWDWNTPYWRDLGAPWGGAHSTIRDVATFLAAFQRSDTSIWKPGTSREMLTLQTASHDAAWGLGWKLGREWFGRSCSASTYGHYGATGTIAWSDPETTTDCVLLTTSPAANARHDLLAAVSDLVSDAATE